MDSVKVFLLTGEWQDTNGRNILRFTGCSDKNTPVEFIINNVKPVFFVDRDKADFNLEQNYERREVNLKSFAGKEVDALYFNTQKELKYAAEKLRLNHITTYESDVDPLRRFLMERFINVQVELTGTFEKRGNLLKTINPKVKACDITPSLRCISIDIETGIENNMLYSIAVHYTWKGMESKVVFILGGEKSSLPEYANPYPGEKELLLAFLKWFKETDPDIIIGWHVIGFDLIFLEKKCDELNIRFDISRGGGKSTFRNRKMGGYYAFIPGRVVIDGPPALRSSFYSFEDFKLETVSQELLGKGKEISPEENKLDEIERRFKEDKYRLAEYNIQDAVLVTEIFRKTGLLDLYVKRAQISGLMLDQLAMMTNAFDHFLLPKIHRYGLVAPNTEDIKIMNNQAGGYVLDPKPGIYEHVLVLDFKSLYPSIIQTFKIDPVSRISSHIKPVSTPGGYKFSSEIHYLPEFIEQLMKQRAEAKSRKDRYLSQAIKILMNSFYGVMGSYGCRFFHPDLPNAITGTGKWLLMGSKEYLEQRDYEVIYGDTDSLFVRPKTDRGDKIKDLGAKIAVELNDYWKNRIHDSFGLKSYLEIEYEKYYRKFIITPARGGEYGAKKRYAGMLENNGKSKLEFVGLEFVRSDWTRLAKDFQEELYLRIFTDQDLEDWIRTFVADINKGVYNEKLVYKKRLRKDVDMYVKSIPPHVKAARLINQNSGTIQYVITKRGPIPVELEHNDIDYQHYIEKQIKPIADSVLCLLGLSYDSIFNTTQLNFFDQLN
ncbi:MAG: DNA polymerase II [Ignavibacteriales bacterium]